MTMALPPLYGIIGSVTGMVAVQIAVQQGTVSLPPWVGAALGFIIGFTVWYFTDAPVTTGSYGGALDDDE